MGDKVDDQIIEIRTTPHDIVLLFDGIVRLIKMISLDNYSKIELHEMATIVAERASKCKSLYGTALEHADPIQ